jgi:hypothetical protein
VRVLFSPPGVTADEIVRDLAQAEPVGRPVVVVSERQAGTPVGRRRRLPVTAAQALLNLLARA